MAGAATAEYLGVNHSNRRPRRAAQVDKERGQAGGEGEGEERHVDDADRNNK